jgi:hypothetical protein
MIFNPNRGCVSSPGLALRLPWESKQNVFQPQRGCGGYDSIATQRTLNLGISSTASWFLVLAPSGCLIAFRPEGPAFNSNVRKGVVGDTIKLFRRPEGPAPA